MNKNKSIELHSIIVDNIDDSKFKKLIEWYFEKAGASNVVIPTKNESDREDDVDIIATFKSIKTIIYVQAQKHKSGTGSCQWALNKINDYVSHKEETMNNRYSKIVWIVSTADVFSETCEEKANLENVQLINGLQFSQMLLEVGLGDLNTVF